MHVPKVAGQINVHPFARIAESDTALSILEGVRCRENIFVGKIEASTDRKGLINGPP